MNKQNKTYNAIDFANYHSGKMPVAEMYALERAALEDDFLADALEGYAYSDNAAEEIVALQNNLTNKNAKVISITKGKNNWLRVAAAAAIVLGLGTLFYNINSNKEANNIAKVETNTAAQTDSIVPQNNINNSDAAIAKEKETDNSISSKNTIGNTAPPEIAVNEPKIIMPQYPMVFSDLNTTPNTTTNFNSIQSNNGIFQNNIESKTGGPKQLAINKNNNQLNNTNYNLDDRAKFKNLAKADSTTFPIAMNDKKIAQDQEQLKEQKAAAPVAPAAAEKADAKMEEVVVSGYGNKKRKDVTIANTTVTTDALSGKVAGVQVNSNSNVGVTKIKSKPNVDLIKANTTTLQEFNSYVKKNIKPVFDDKGNEIKGTVKLSFKTNKAGQPIKIKVMQSLSKKADAQATELLKNAVKWQANKSDRNTVEVNF